MTALTGQHARNLPAMRIDKSALGYTATDFNDRGRHQAVTEGTDATLVLVLLPRRVSC